MVTVIEGWPMSVTIFLTLLLHYTTFTDALPAAVSTPTTVLSTRPEILYSIELGDDDKLKPYSLEPFDDIEQGRHSTTYKIVDGYEDTPAVLKTVLDVGRLEEMDKEIHYTILVGLWLSNRTITQVDAPNIICLVMKDVRVDFPNKGDPGLKLFHEWYLADTNMDLDLELFRLLYKVEMTLYEFAVRKGLLYCDFHLGNIFVDKTLKTIMPIDWGTPTYPFPGVLQVSEKLADRDREIEIYDDYIIRNIPKRFNIQRLSIQLERRDKTLRPADQAELTKLPISGSV